VRFCNISVDKAGFFLYEIAILEIFEGNSTMTDIIIRPIIIIAGIISPLDIGDLIMV
jgi:hypothetical protein